MARITIDEVESPEDVVDLSYETNYWVDSAPRALFFIVDANFVVLLLCSALNIQSPTVLTVLAVSFVVLAVLEYKDISLKEGFEWLRTKLARERSLRY